MSVIVTVFSFRRNGYVNYELPRFGSDKEGRAMPAKPIGMPNGDHFAYRRKADAEARLDPLPLIEAIPLREPLIKINAAYI